MPAIPFLDYCRIERIETPGEKPRFEVDAVAPLTNSRDAAHGGLLMTLLDVTMGQAVLAETEGATSFATMEMNVSFLRPGHGRIAATATVLRTGRSVAFAESEVRDQAGVLVAKASGLFKPIF